MIPDGIHSAPLLIGEPKPGTYKMRLAKGGVWVPAKITRSCACTIGGEVEHEWAEPCDRYPRLRAVVNGNEARDPLQIWTYCHPVTMAEYRFMLADNEWCRDYAPDLPQANPRESVDLQAMKPLF